MAPKKVQYPRCASHLVIATYQKYVSFHGIRDALILNFFLCHPGLTINKLLIIKAG